MHCRDITEAEFETIAAELIMAKTQGDDVELTGHHEDHGAVVLIRDATRCMVLAAELAFIDMMQARAAASAGSAALARTMRAGRAC